MANDAEAIARRFATRPGCRFIGYAPVGIAVFSMNLRVLILEQRHVPPIEEFILRLAMEGVESLRWMSNLLGIDIGLVKSRLIDFRRSEFIDVTHEDDEGDIHVNLTDRGREIAKSLHQNVMQEITIPDVVFHGLLRVPVQLGGYGRRQYLRPKEANDGGLTLIRAIPNRYPHPEEINIDILNQMFKRGLRKGESLRTIGAIKGVLKRVYTLYEPAVMLEYETNDERRERQVAFVVDGQLKEEYESTFSRERGPELLPDLITPTDEPLGDRVRRLASKRVLQRLGNLDDVEDLAAKVHSVRQEVADAKREFESADRADTRSRLQHKIEILESEKAKLEEERNARSVKYLWTPEIREKFHEAIRTAEGRLLILSGFISSGVVNKLFEQEMSATLARGVKVWIGYGFDKGNQRGADVRGRKSWKDAEDVFKRLKNQFPENFVYKDVGDSHEKRLICDNRFTFGGSFNLLSFSGEDRGREKLRHEGADLIEDQEFCEQLYEKYLGIFFRDAGEIS